MAEKRDYIRHHRPSGVSVSQGCRLMGIARSTYYHEQVQRIGEMELLAAIIAICDEFEAYGWRRVRAALQHQGICANQKRLMREHSLQPRRRRRYVATTDSGHDLPIFPDLAKDVALTGADQLWVADLTYVAIASGFAYVAIILDAWSRRVVGYAIGRSIDARLAIAALEAAIASRQPSPGLIHHSDRGPQGGFNRSSQHQEIGGCEHGRSSSIRTLYPREATIPWPPTCLAARAPLPVLAGDRSRVYQ